MLLLKLHEGREDGRAIQPFMAPREIGIHWPIGCGGLVNNKIRAR